ncbi:DUF726 domain-containing protein [Herbaspirillum sp. B65]|uniref:DUF726 domain-containing protein n=1 Tax=Herbaspirillum sp. B65 TaxID=137708 RepID=UPI00034A76EC|nr:DUF726 domain-containing protein [Herbaspirillum sp. B65]
MTSLDNRYCSWCYKKTHHFLSERNVISRNVYECGTCCDRSIECRVPGCQNMARSSSESSDHLCAEHNGAIAAFESLNVKLNDINEYKKIFERRSINVARAAKIGVGVAGGIAVFTPAVLAAGPALASALGSAGLLGAAGTGTAISSLSGAALTSASLAAIGGGTMAGGTIIVSAAGAALGAYQGAVVSNSYFGQVGHFDISRIQYGNKHAIIVLNGFLSQGESNVDDWREQLQMVFPKNSWYHTDWEAHALRKLGQLVAIAPKAAGLEFAKGLAKQALKTAGKKIAPFSILNSLTDLVANPWHRTMVKAQMTGVMLADAIARTPGWKFTLAGHSLGARAVYFTLKALATQDKPRIENVYLLGGAVGGGEKDDEGWEQAARAVKGKIYNCHSSEDTVLRYLYQGANGLQSKPIGYWPIHLEHDKIFNFDCTELVSGHLQWKSQFAEIVKQLKPYK